MMAGVDEHELPVDPDYDDLPAELAEHPGPMRIIGVDQEGNAWETPITHDQLAAAFGDSDLAA